ncbi:MAG TPA: sigma-70 family RNA polymerase sigma factor [Kofleriaceae bacterium]|nr:sigma-70 family RNA polymerase sigma factor [Kofleriaceae bacterium]
MHTEDVTWLARQFENKRAHLREVAYRMLGSAGEAEDAVQEAWIRVSHADTAGVTNLGGWLTTVTSRICLDMLRSRKTRLAAVRAAPEVRTARDPARDAMLADSIGAALVVVLERLTPSERVAFVLHDMFDLPFDEIARIIDRTEAATRQLASRARRRVQLREPDGAESRARRDLVDAFLAASRDGNLEALIALLDGDVVVRADATAVRTATATRWIDERPGLARETRGVANVAALFKGRAGGATSATIDGEPGAVWAVRSRVRGLFVFTILDGRIREIEIVMDRSSLAEHDVALAGS